MQTPFIIPVLDKLMEANDDERLQKLLFLTFSRKDAILETFLVPSIITNGLNTTIDCDLVEQVYTKIKDVFNVFSSY
jgi:hypothetical protein